ncbi:NAD(P)/FAD-dependent oxidoreductase [Streptomyces sp. x-80]|uniref:NAD(P)/FAD-dependent oxidoreductase n=1 Tax=Streptomyces sp. x-80 TaxID=2789282 RepID=UPI00397F0213
MTTRPNHVAVVGASAAGLAAAETLRREGYDGRLTFISAEEHLPYDRPPLSKQVLSGAWAPERTALRDPAAITALDADFLLGATATGLDPVARRVHLAGDRALDYDALVITTGVAARRLPQGHDLSGVQVLRTLDDALALRDRLRSEPKVVVVGAGVLGTEAAAAARRLGLSVTVVDPLPAPVIRQFGARIGSLVAGLHREHGVRLLTGTGVDSLSAADGRVTGVRLTNGMALDADLVLVAIGSVPGTAWLAGSGLSLSNGVDCDALCRAAPGIVAAGDVASWAHPELGRIRVENRTNATEQAAAAARALLGKGSAYAPIPFFWTDQYDVRIQAYGFVPEDAEPAVVVGDPAEGKFAALYGAQGEVVAALAWNLPRELRALRQHVVSRTPWEQAVPPALR